MNKNRLLGVSISVVLLLIAVFFFIGDESTPANLKPVNPDHQPPADTLPESAQSCVACHGMEGNSTNPQWPNLAAQKVDYLAGQLKSYRAGLRDNVVMTPLAKTLSDQDIDQLAQYYSSKQLQVTANGNAEKVNAGEHAAAYCMPCHGIKGQTANTEWPNLAGQHAAYLQQQLTAFRDGSRVNNTIMNTIVAGYSDEQLEALAAFYSQLQP